MVKEQVTTFNASGNVGESFPSTTRLVMPIACSYYADRLGIVIWKLHMFWELEMM
jgi:hypothetical protein